MKRFPFSLRVCSHFLFILGLALPSYSATSEEYYQAGLSLYQKADYAKAIEYLRAAVQVDPNHWQANQVMGYAFYQTHDNPAALAAFDRSLAVHPDNPALRQFSDRIRAVSALPPPLTSPTAPPPGSEMAPPISPSLSLPLETKTVFRSGRWTNIHAGPIFASMGDFQTGATSVKIYFPANMASASVDNLGIMLGAEGGLCFDNENAISLGIDMSFFGGYKDQFTFGPNSGTDSFVPMMASIEAKYSRLIAIGSSRLRIGIGPGIYITSLDVEQTFNTISVVTGSMVGLGFGGALSLSYELYLNQDFMLNLFGEGRFAPTSNIQGDFKDTAGNIHKVGLIMDSNNFIGTAYTSSIGTNGFRWASVDYTGGNLGLGVSYHY